ncbi:hypothetical protein [Eubacterium sp.]|uniref:hypothetical protein n=1 Tax=Eubacterium sp. TaxID=142586 RepID=UPI0026E08031|nr:hypothetical protein [Eubacterium sp.]MDO5431379.1 hypothetical protein [Eubacterium sp.]
MPAIDKLNYFIQYLFDYTLKHKEFEGNYHENSEIRASRIDKVAAKMVENLIPIMEEGIRVFLTIKTDWVVLKVNEFTRIQNLCQIIQKGKTI